VGREGRGRGRDRGGGQQGGEVEGDKEESIMMGIGTCLVGKFERDGNGRESGCKCDGEK
jgi:hypothetical protein